MTLVEYPILSLYVLNTLSHICRLDSQVFLEIPSVNSHQDVFVSCFVAL